MAVTFQPAVTVQVTGGSVLPPGSTATVTGLSISSGDLVFVFQSGIPYLGTDDGWYWECDQAWVTNLDSAGRNFRTLYGEAPTAASSLSFTLKAGRAYSLALTVVVVTGGDLTSVAPGGVLSTPGAPYPGFEYPGEYVILAGAFQYLINNFMVFSSRPDFTWLTNSGQTTVGWAGPIPGGASGSLSGSGSISGAYSWMAAFAIADLSSGDRTRSNVSEDAGSLFQATQAVAVELGVSEAFPYGEDVPAGQLRAFREALTPDEVAQRYYALPTRNQEMLTTVEGETNLGRSASTYPSPIMQTALTIPGQSGGRVTAQQAIQFVVNQWEQEHPWLSFEPIPDLRLVMPGAVAEPRQHYLDNPTDGILTTAAVVIEQEGNNRRTMREILDEWLSVFPGTLRQNSSGRIEIVPHVGPDAPDGPQVQLGWRDLISLSDGEDDPRGVVNRCRVLSQGWEYREGQALLPPTYTLATRSDGLAASSMEDVLPDTEPLPNGTVREFDLFLDPSTPVTLNVLFSAYTGASRTSNSPFQEAEIPASFTLGLGQTVRRTFTWTIFNVDNVQTNVDFTRTQNGVRVTVSSGGRYAFGPNPFVGMRYAAYLVEILSAEGTAWVRDNTSVEAEFGSASDELPGADGTDALAASRALHGERLATIHSNVFQLTPEQAQQIARSHVLWNINPRTIRDVRQSEWDRYPVKFDHIGRHVELPNGEVALVENRAYSDSFSATHGTMMSTFSAAVTEVVLDTSTDWLYLDSGDFFELDDGTPVERS